MSQDWSGIAAVAMRVLVEHGGVAKTAHFLAAGVSPLQLAGLRNRGFVERPRSGWYADPALPWRGKHAVRVGGVLTCVSAAQEVGLPVPPGWQERTHVLLPGNAPRVRHHARSSLYVVPGEDREVARHWSKEDGTRAGWRTDLIDTLVELAECVPLDWWVAAVDAAMHRPRGGGEPMLDAADLPLLRTRLPKQMRAALELVDPQAESCLESLLRLGLGRRDVALVVSQFQPDRSGVRRYEADLLVGRRLLVEADGEAYHDPEKDAIRDAYLRSLGYVVLRFTHDEIVNDLDRVLDDIEAALAALESAAFVL